MIRHTFSLLNGIGEKLERHLWRAGILTWNDFCSRKEINGISPERKSMYDNQLLQASMELGVGNAEYFARIMKRREHWRLFDTFRKDAVCLDIETNGFQPESGGYVTVVGLYDGNEWKCLIRGENLTVENLKRELSGYKCLITFYGSAFDVPFLMRSFPGVRFDIPHFDLCFGSRRLDINGGLKKLEELFGIERKEVVKGMNGYDAVKLWEQARKGSAEARELLLLYNREDTMNLLRLADILYPRLRSSTGIGEFVTCGYA
ncbi:MAG: ribonuclease H-like domain-containing protein [Alphaproteobacteria bacterium]|uniref:Ribonuclease H-like domain-containing protein n=1 Tax=Candidatus Nitrobium versatile TaxID=2884831 RepID=A0A953J4Y9_9BACT|nr:ribonuclease H-like domain-containing protein [Candidatus Nitrobium versatile]